MGKIQTIPVPGLLTEATAAEFLGISPSTLRNLKLPRRELGAKRLYDRRDLQDYIDNLPYEGENASPRDEAAEWFERNG